MIFDSTILAAVASEMRARLGAKSRDNAGRDNNGRDKSAAVLRDVWQNENDERQIFLQFRDATFLVDTHPQRASCYFLSQSPRPENTQFSGVLRKALRGSQLVKISQPNFDRILRLEFLARDETAENLSSSTRYSLVCELMNRRANVILLDENETIIDAVKRLPPFLNRARTVLPHQTYQAPPSNRENPLLVTNWRDRVLEASSSAVAPNAVAPNAVAPAENLDSVLWLRGNFTAISPVLARAIQHNIGHSQDAVATCETVWEQVKKVAHGQYKSFVGGNQPYPLAFDGACVSDSRSISALLEHFATREDEHRVLDDGRGALLAHLNKKLKSNGAQLDDARKAAAHATEAEKYLRIGNLILMRAPTVEAAIDAKTSRVTLLDEANVSHEIEIESDWSVGDNAARWFNRYKRAQKIAANAPARESILEGERAQFEAWKSQVQNAPTPAAVEVLAQIVGFARDEKTVSRTRQQEESSRPENRVRSRDIEGWTVFIGRSAIENQLLLSKIARASDVWMHVRDAPSAHVIVKNPRQQNVPDRVLDEAARWLAQSARKGKSGDVLEIIYTPAKFVRAIKGAPGRVTLARFQTRLVET